MKVRTLRLVGLRCFEDSGEIALSPTCNLFVGQNNSGKSTILKGLLAYQGFPFMDSDVRPGAALAYHYIITPQIPDGMEVLANPRGSQDQGIFALRTLAGNHRPIPTDTVAQHIDAPGWFYAVRPNHYIVPFIAKRKAEIFRQGVATSDQNEITGTFKNIYSRIDLLATAGHPKHAAFQKAIQEIIGLPLTTKAALNGKEAGFYFDQDHFVPLNQMGDGVSEMAGLIVELCLERNKLFIIEEPETNLHPRGLKALLALVRNSWCKNQFVIATHSNIVVRELGYDEATKVFRVSRGSEDPRSPSKVEELAREPHAHAELLRELGYEFADLGLYDAWLFLEESSAEQVIRDTLIPMFVPGLSGRLRTFSAGGASKLEPSVSEFQRLVTFVHLQPAYRGRLWVRADNDPDGRAAIDGLRRNFKYLTEKECAVFEESAFEKYFPRQFQNAATNVLAVSDKQARRRAKAELLRDVLRWTSENPGDARVGWSTSAVELIRLLEGIWSTIADG